MTLRIVLLALGLSSATAFAEVAVIVHPSNASALSAEEVQRLFLGKLKSFPAGSDASPVNLNLDLCARVKVTPV